MGLQKKIIIENIFGWCPWLATCRPRSNIKNLKKTYCSKIGYEFMHMGDPDEKNWIRNRIEGPEKGIKFTENGKKSNFK